MSELPNFNALNLDVFGDIPFDREVKVSTVRHDRGVHRLTPGQPVEIRFLTDPPDPWEFDAEMCMNSSADGSWVKYREIAAGQDLIGKNPDGRVTHLFIPVADYHLNSPTSRSDRKDPVQRNLKASDKELANKSWGRPYPKARDSMLVSVIFEGGSFARDTNAQQYDPEPGTVILISLKDSQYKRMKQIMLDNVEVHDIKDFSWTQGTWTLVWAQRSPTDQFDWHLTMTVKKDVPPLSVKPTPLDGRMVLKAIRATTEQELFGLDELLAEQEAVDVEEEVAAFEEAALSDEEVPEWDRTPVQPRVEADSENPFKKRSPAWVKGMLKKAKVDFDPRTPNSELYELAHQHLPADIAG